MKLMGSVNRVGGSTRSSHRVCLEKHVEIVSTDFPPDFTVS